MNKNFSIEEKRRYYAGKIRSELDENKRSYARGFIDGSSVNHTQRHFRDCLRERKELFKELESTKDMTLRQDIYSSISYYSGCLAGFRSKEKKN